MYGPSGNSQFCFPSSPDDQDSRENKTNCFPRDHTLSVQCRPLTRALRYPTIQVEAARKCSSDGSTEFYWTNISTLTCLFLQCSHQNHFSRISSQICFGVTMRTGFYSWVLGLPQLLLTGTKKQFFCKIQNNFNTSNIISNI